MPGTSETSQNFLEKVLDTTRDKRYNSGMENNTTNTTAQKFNSLYTVDAHDAFARDPEFANFCLTLGDAPTLPEGHADVLSFDDATAVGFAEYSRTGLLVRFEVTGRTDRSGLVRVRLTSAEDNNDAAGTVNFTSAKSVGGWANFFRFANTK